MTAAVLQVCFALCLEIDDIRGSSKVSWVGEDGGGIWPWTSY